MTNAWLNAFGSQLNSASNSTDLVLGNGLGNQIGGNIAVLNAQHVGDYGLWLWTLRL